MARGSSARPRRSAAPTRGRRARASRRAARSPSARARPLPARGRPAPHPLRPNELVAPRRPPAASWRQFTHPLALLLWAAAAARAGRRDRRSLAVAIVAVILLNAALRLRPGAAGGARGRGAGGATCRRTRPCVRDGREQQVDAASSCPATSSLLAEGDRISADARLLAGALELDMSALTGESLPVFRVADATRPASRCSRPATSSSAARRAPAARRAASCSRPGCTPSSAGSPRCPSASAATRARWSVRCGRSPG